MYKNSLFILLNNVFKNIDFLLANIFLIIILRYYIFNYYITFTFKIIEYYVIKMIDT